MLGWNLVIAKGTRSLGRQFGLIYLLDELKRDDSLSDPDRFQERSKALDRLDGYDLDSQRPEVDLGENGGALHVRATALRTELEAINSRLYEGIRDAIRRGDGRDALLRWAPASKNNAVLRRHESIHDGDTYDDLDDLVSGILQFAPPDSATIELSPEMVAYQPTPARHILELIRHSEIADHDVFFDLGSGLGHVPLLVAICTKSGVVGIDIELAYVECARRCARQLNLANATFVTQDARDADLSEGTIFYLYTPFRGAILRAVLDRLRGEANKREIRVCTFGPCTPIVAAESWLSLDAAESSEISVFRSRR